MNDLKNPCVIPWMHRYTNEQGFQMLCCVGDGDSNQLHNAAGVPLHVGHGLTDAELLNSPDLKAIRRAMLQGEWPTACERCRRDEHAGATSHRLYMEDRFGHWLPASITDTAQDGTLGTPQVRYADIRLGNVCNLTCRMCGPTASRLWADLYNIVQPGSYMLPAPTLAQLRNQNWVKSPSVAWLIEQCLPSIDLFHFAGGEPLIIPEMVEALELCIRSGRAHEINLSYNTNLTVLPDKVTQLWQHFKSVLITASIDGYGALNEYIRRPSKWCEIDANLHALDQNFERWKLRSVSCNLTLQVYNVLQLEELYDYLTTSFKKIIPVPRLSPLYTPEYLSVQILPSRVKDVVRQRLTELQKKIDSSLPSGHLTKSRYLDSAISFMDAAQVEGQLPNFLYFSEKSDRQFNDSWRKACPELASLLLLKPAGAPAPHLPHGLNS